MITSTAHPAVCRIMHVLLFIISTLSVLGSGVDVESLQFPVKDPLGRPRTVNASPKNHRFCENSRYMKRPKYAGYVDVDRKLGSSMYYAYYEAQHMGDKRRTPILLWLQGGPGCASTFGAFYELGPYIIDDSGRHKWNPRLVRNPGSWNKIFGLLIIDQPIGTGFSLVGKDKIPEDELGVASHLYTALHGFFSRHHHLQQRPFFITGESYGGKYVPSIAHYILQAKEMQAPSQPGSKQLKVTRSLEHHVQAPNFNFTGIAIGNAWVDPAVQTVQIADVVHRMGLVAESGKKLVQNLTMQVLGLMEAGEWKEAHRKRSHMISVLEHLSGVGTLLDVRRYEPYDSTQAVDRLLNCRDVKRKLRADRRVRYESCSEKVDEALSADVMQSVANLIPDILNAVPVLVYQGQFDAQDGPSSNEAWIADLDWAGRDAFLSTNASLWRSPYGDVQGWYKLQAPLSQVVIRNAGHLVPHDQPIPALEMIAGWVYLTLTNRSVQLGPVPSALLEGGWEEDTLKTVKFGPDANKIDVGVSHKKEMYKQDDDDDNHDDDDKDDNRAMINREHDEHDADDGEDHHHDDNDDDDNDDDNDDGDDAKESADGEDDGDDMRENKDDGDHAKQAQDADDADDATDAHDANENDHDEKADEQTVEKDGEDDNNDDGVKAEASAS